MFFFYSTSLFTLLLFSFVLLDKTSAVYSDDYEEDEFFIRTPTTTIVDEHSHSGVHYSHSLDDYDEKQSDDSWNELTLPPLSSSSSSLSKSTMKMTTTSTRSTTSVFSTFPDHGMFWLGVTSTRDPQLVAAFLAKTNRDRLILKICAIFMITSMVTLALVLIIMHVLGKKRRYNGYGLPTTQSSTNNPTRS